jgi:hypothetical protein
MAIFNASLKSGKAPDGVFAAFCETSADITDPATDVWAAGSVLVCLNTDDDKVPTTYVKLPEGEWSEVSN